MDTHEACVRFGYPSHAWGVSLLHTRAGHCTPPSVWVIADGTVITGYRTVYKPTHTQVTEMHKINKITFLKWETRFEIYHRRQKAKSQNIRLIIRSWQNF